MGPFRELRMKKTALAGATRMQIGPFRELRIKKTALGGIKDHNDTRHMELRMIMTRASWNLRMIMTRASWTDTGVDGSL